MDSLTTPTGVGTSSSSEGQVSYESQRSTAPLLNSPPSVDDRVQNGKAQAENGSSSYAVQADSDGDPEAVQNNGNHDDAKIDVNGVQNVKTEMEMKGGDEERQQNGVCSASEAGDYGKRGTSIPMREEFRCRRFWFFYHDIRALTTSWIPLPIFIVYRIILLLYIFAWMITSGIDRSPRQGAKWLLLITNHAIIQLVIGFLSINILTIGYTIVYYVSKEKLQRFYPKPAPTAQALYSQDNITWYMKLCWILYLTGVVTSISIIFGFWVAVYTPCKGSHNITDSNEMVVNNTMLEPTQSGMEAGACDVIDAVLLHVHLILGLLATIDIFLSRIPYQIFHVYIGLIYMASFIIFSAIYYGAGGTNHREKPYIYSVLDYGGNPGRAVGFAIVMMLVQIVSFTILYLLAWLRDVIYRRINFCFRDIRSTEYSFTSSDEKSNGQWEPTTKVEVSTNL